MHFLPLTENPKEQGSQAQKEVIRARQARWASLHAKTFQRSPGIAKKIPGSNWKGWAMPWAMI